VQGDELSMLAGRIEDKSHCSHEVQTHQLVVLHSAPGVGKTSFLQAGLIPELNETGFTVALCRDWRGSAEHKDPVALLARNVRQAVQDKLPGSDLPDDQSLFEVLNHRLGELCVIILDQFDDVIRYSSALTDQLLEWLIKLNKNTDFHVVISVRSDYVYHFKKLNTHIRPFSLSTFELEEIGTDAVRNVILSANRDDFVAITPEAADMVINLWNAARRDQDLRGTPFHAQVGLLHLQSLLYALSAKVSSGPVEAEYIETVQAGYGPGELFAHGLSLAVREKMRRCQAASETIGLQPHLIEATSQNLAGAVWHLLSGGYGMGHSDVHDLMMAALGTRLGMLLGALAKSSDGSKAQPDGPASDSQLRMLLTVLLDMILSDHGLAGGDLLKSSRQTIAAATDEACSAPEGFSWLALLHDGSDCSSAYPAGVSYGPMAGLAPAAELIEELRGFVFALEWLRETSLIRISAPGANGAMVAFTQDRFRPALQEWATKDAPPQEPTQPIADREGDDPGLLFRIYIPSGRLYASEAERLLTLFREWMGTVRRRGFRQASYRTRAGTLYEVFGDLSSPGLNVRWEFTEFSGFLTLCATDSPAALEQLADIGLSRAACSDMVTRYGKEIRRLSVDLRHERERRVMAIRQNLESELFDQLGEADIAMGQLSGLIETLVPNPTPAVALRGLGPASPAVSAPVVITVNQNVINAVRSQVHQNVQGTVNLAPDAKEILDIINRLGGEEASELQTAVYELEDPDMQPPGRVAAKRRLKDFLRRLGESAQDIAVDLLSKYLETKVGI
jgi:hypothetical protein